MITRNIDCIRIYNAKKKKIIITGNIDSKSSLTESGYELKVRVLFESIFRVIMFFFLRVVHSNTCDKIRMIRRTRSHVIMQEISTFVILKATGTDRQTRRLYIFRIFGFIWHQIIHK